MMRRLLVGVLWAVPAYVVGAIAGGYLLSVASTNQHDVSVEAAMTGAFVFGPLAGLVAFITGVARAKAGPPPD